MGLADQLASAIDRRDEQPNIKLAQKLAKQGETSGDVLELISIVKHGSKPQQHDAIKVLYELAALKPNVFADKLAFAFDLLETKDNRTMWGTLTLLSKICAFDLDTTYENLSQILDAAARGSVIAKDATFEILLALANSGSYQDQAGKHVVSFLADAAPNQLPMYAEKTAEAELPINTDDIVHALFSRLDEMPTEAKREQLEKAIAKISLPPKPLALV